MAAVVRVKRLLEEPSVNVFVINCKRRKISADDDNEAEDLTTLLKIAGTVENQEDFLVKKPTKTQLEEEYKRHTIDINAKLREAVQKASKNNRYKVVNCFRSVDTNVDVDNEFSCTVYDIETKDSEVVDDKKQYVYDLYYTTSDYLGEEDLNECLSIYPLSNDLIYGSLRDNGYNEADSEVDSDDSNAENNWRNDYPDESDLDSINEEDMINAFKNCNLNEDDDLSTEDEIYDNADSFDNVNDLDETDVERFGQQYAKFKAKAKKYYDTSSDNSCHYDDDEESNINEIYY